MPYDAHIRRRTCLGFGLGLAADVAFPRAPEAASVVDDAGPWGTYKTIISFRHRVGKLPNGLMCASDGMPYGTTELAGSYGYGTLYCVDAHERVHVLHSFGASRDDFIMPSSPPTEGDDDALYGVVNAGGGGSEGGVYRLGRDGRWDILHAFSNRRAEGYLSSRLVLGSDGQFYGSNALGGTYNGGVVYRLGKDGTVTPLWQLGEPGGPDYPQAALIEGVDGRLYGTSRDGGAGDYYGTIFSLAKDGSDPRVVHSFERSGGWNPGPVVQGMDGYLYGTTRYGGQKGFGTAYRVAPDGSDHSVLHDFAHGRASSPLLEIEPGVLAGTSFPDSSNGGSLFVLTTDGRFHVLRSFGGRNPHGDRDGDAPAGPLCRAPSGELVGTCNFGGAVYGGTLWFARAPDGSWGAGLRT